jgi:hypothetical protein
MSELFPLRWRSVADFGGSTGARTQCASPSSLSCPSRSTMRKPHGGLVRNGPGRNRSPCKSAVSAPGIRPGCHRIVASVVAPERARAARSGTGPARVVHRRPLPSRLVAQPCGCRSASGRECPQRDSNATRGRTRSRTDWRPSLLTPEGGSTRRSGPGRPLDGHRTTPAPMRRAARRRRPDHSACESRARARPASSCGSVSSPRR